MKNVKTRILQDILRIEQIRLDTVTNEYQRKVIKNRISNIASELLYRLRSNPL